MSAVFGVAFTGDAEDRTARSGTPYGVLSGLRSLGVEAFALKATMPTNVDRALAALDGITHLAQRREWPSQGKFKAAYQGAHLGRATSITRSLAARARTVRRDVTGVIALGSGYTVGIDVPYVIYDDMTVKQAIDLGYPAWRAMRETDRQYRLRQQVSVYSRAVKCCMTTQWAADSVVSDYGIPESKVVVVGAGTHEERRNKARDWSTPRFLFVGKDWQRKNGPRVVRAFGSVRDRFPDATLDVVGGHPVLDEPGVRTHGMLSRDDAGDRATLAGLYEKATCFVMPSIHEPGGVVLVEAAASGVGCIAGSRGGSRDFVGDGGLVVDPFDDAQIVASMERFADPEFAASHGSAAFTRSAHFTWPRVAERLLHALVEDGGVTRSTASR
ncbi:glycosyltransferase family 4 protein [uncultured Williamsia sp.]|uniref:glycosyltransferase family 4 protein n=1 Tax=uncultured Williamsia sp. TaxID=259311 RepID=UPI002604DB3B|nr:glycosyltransferase family 4 protein [uncultured Williamsia sp.]